MEPLVIVGLGPGDPDALTLEAQQVLREAREVVVRTRHHPAVVAIRSTLRIRSYDAVARRCASPTEVDSAIVRDVIARARRSGVIYAVPGHPLVGEPTVHQILAIAEAEAISCRIVGGVSGLEPVFTVLRLDPFAAGLQVLDARTLVDEYLAAADRAPEGRRNPFGGTYQPVRPHQPALVGQIGDRRLASAVKQVLLHLYPPDHVVELVGAPGVPGRTRVVRLPLSDLDRDESIDRLTWLHLPPLDPLEDVRSFDSLRHVVARLRAPGGCPWDREQTHASLKAYLLEETYEVLEALDLGDAEKLAEELGDLLLQVVLHAQLAIEDDEFELEDVFAHITTKLIRRHPHVFGDRVVADVAEVLRNWESIKKAERAAAGEPESARSSALDGVAALLPALARSQALQRRAARAGFEWVDDEEALRKVNEELDEVRAAASNDERLDEVGDLLFAVVSVARRLGVDAEEALRLANLRFADRFRRLEANAAAEGKALADASADELRRWWRAAKQSIQRRVDKHASDLSAR